MLRYFQAASDGTFWQPSDFPNIPLTSEVVGAGDWDGDGDTDLITWAGNGLKNIRYYERLQAGTNSLVERNGSAFQYVRIQYVKQFLIADWNSDGLADLLHMEVNDEPWRSKLVLWQQRPDGSLDHQREVVGEPKWHDHCYFDGTHDSFAVSLIDYNGDGMLDVVMKEIPQHTGMAEVSLCERTNHDDFAQKSSLFAFAPFKYQNHYSLHAIPCWSQQEVCFVLDTDIWSRGFCIKEDACASRGACAVDGCSCAEGYRDDCSQCDSQYHAPHRRFGSHILCARCAGDEQVCAKRGVCDDDRTRTWEALNRGSNMTARLVSGTGSCACSEEYFGGTDAQGRITCVNGRCPGGTTPQLRTKQQGGLTVEVYQCETCPDGTASNGGECIPCAPGRAARNGSSECAACSAGRFMATKAAADCMDCPAGTWSREGQPVCTECQPGRAANPGSGQCLLCQAGRFAASSGAAECVECPPGTKKGNFESRCSPCESGMISGPGQSSCERCAGTFWVMTSDMHRLQCQNDPVAMVLSAVFLLTVCACWYLLLTSCLFWIHISDLTLVKGKAIITTHSPHRILKWTWNQPVVKLRQTGVPCLDDASAPFVVKATDGKRVELFDGNDAEKSFSALTTTSMGQLGIDFLPFWWNVGFLGIPSLAWLLLFLVMAILASVKVQPFMQCIIVLLSLFTAMASFAWRRTVTLPSTSLALARKRFEVQLLKENPHPEASERGAARALSLSKLKELYSFFNAFIQDRTMYYVCSNLVIPLTEPFKLSYAELAGCSEVVWFVSHYWGMPLRHTVEALCSHSRSRQAISDSDSYWICTFSNNQWRVTEELGRGDWKDSSFFLALRSCSCRGTLMIIDEEALPLQRAWCLFEVLQTLLRFQEDGSFTGFSLGTSSGVLNEGGVGTDLCMVIAERLAKLDLRHARATEPKDEAMIRSLVETMPGGFDSMNEFIRNSIHNALLSVRARFDEDFKQVLTSLRKGQQNLDLLTTDLEDILPTEQ